MHISVIDAISKRNAWLKAFFLFELVVKPVLVITAMLLSLVVGDAGDLAIWFESPLATAAAVGQFAFAIAIWRRHRWGVLGFLSLRVLLILSGTVIGFPERITPVGAFISVGYLVILILLFRSVWKDLS
jgi:hypothetical protein